MDLAGTARRTGLTNRLPEAESSVSRDNVTRGDWHLVPCPSLRSRLPGPWQPTSSRWCVCDRPISPKMQSIVRRVSRAYLYKLLQSVAHLVHNLLNPSNTKPRPGMQSKVPGIHEHARRCRLDRGPAAQCKSAPDHRYSFQGCRMEGTTCSGSQILHLIIFCFRRTSRSRGRPSHTEHSGTLKGIIKPPLHSHKALRAIGATVSRN